jgi:hypothetical protein
LALPPFIYEVHVAESVFEEADHIKESKLDLPPLTTQRHPAAYLFWASSNTLWRWRLPIAN